MSETSTYPHHTWAQVLASVIGVPISTQSFACPVHKVLFASPWLLVAGSSERRLCGRLLFLRSMVRVRFIGLVVVWVVARVVFGPLFGIYHLWAPLGVEACRVGGGSSEVGSTRRL